MRQQRIYTEMIFPVRAMLFCSLRFCGNGWNLLSEKYILLILKLCRKHILMAKCFALFQRIRILPCDVEFNIFMLIFSGFYFF